MKGNQFYTVFGIVTAVLLGAVGFYCYQGYSAYKEAGGGFNKRRTDLTRLKRSKPYPNEENLGEIGKQVKDYEEKIQHLFKSLDRFQQPLNSNIDDRQFPQILKAKIEAFKILAKKKGFKIEGEKEFYMAMDAYRTTPPDIKAVPLLDYQLGAIEYLLNTLVEVGVSELIDLDRELLPEERTAGGKSGEDVSIESSAVAAKYPVSLTFETKHPAFVKLVNQITNDDKYFFILRALRVDNSAKEGLVKGDGEDGANTPSYVNAVGEEAPEDLVNKIPPDLDVPGQVDWMREHGGFELQSSDARILLGNEKLRVFMVIDLVRFADASAKVSGKGNLGKGQMPQK
ncbi:MAG: Amuc_1100 family pilus-like protein [Verrucomicrobiota bacterium]